MNARDISLKIVTNADGVRMLSYALPTLLGAHEVGLRGFKLLPQNGSIASCILTVSFEHGDMTPEQKSLPLRRAIESMSHIASVIQVPTVD